MYAISGKGLKDLVLNYQYVFEVSEIQGIKGVEGAELEEISFRVRSNTSRRRFS